MSCIVAYHTVLRRIHLGESTFKHSALWINKAEGGGLCRRCALREKTTTAAKGCKLSRRVRAAVREPESTRLQDEGPLGPSKGVRITKELQCHTNWQQFHRKGLQHVLGLNSKRGITRNADDDGAAKAARVWKMVGEEEQGDMKSQSPRIDA